MKTSDLLCHTILLDTLEIPYIVKHRPIYTEDQEFDDVLTIIHKPSYEFFYLKGKFVKKIKV